jgi:hypothetical protein
MLLEDAPGSNSPVGVREPHFPVFPEYRDASYVRRYEQLLLRLVRERLYDGVCLLLSDRKLGAKGEYREPHPELAFAPFAASLTARASAHLPNRENQPD